MPFRVLLHYFGNIITKFQVNPDMKTHAIVMSYTCSFDEYANDTKLYLDIRSVCDCNKLQRFINYFVTLCIYYDLLLNIRKCKIVILQEQVTYFVQSSKIRLLNSFKVLYRKNKLRQLLKINWRIKQNFLFIKAIQGSLKIMSIITITS